MQQKNQIIFVMFILWSQLLGAQVFTGGDFTLSYNNGIYLDAAPIIGYNIDDLKLRVGYAPVLSITMPNDAKEKYAYGSRIFAEYSVIENFFLHAEIEAMNIENPSGDPKRKWILAAPMGAGYEYTMKSGMQAYAMVLYDVLLDKDSDKENPVVRAGVRYDF